VADRPTGGISRSSGSIGEELAAVDAIAERDHISRSEAIRRALAGFAA
jgi:hypothetical protein